MITFSYTILYVNDVYNAMDFYQRAFGFSEKFKTPENDYGEMISGSTTIAFASKELAQSNLSGGFLTSSAKEKPFGIELGFVTTDVAAAVEKAVAEGAVLYEPLKTKPWGQSVAYVRDLDGFLIELCSPMG